MTHHRTPRTPGLRIITILCCVTLAACSDKQPVEPTVPPTPLPPVVTGVVVGPPATATIGAAGGTLALADGSASITVPAGALSRATELSIQPITNIAPNGIGNGVRIGPENLTFAVPVTVTINYAATAADSSSPDGFGIARQDSTGAWMAYLESSVTPSVRVGTVSSASLRVSTAARGGGGAVAARTQRTGHYVPGRLWIFRPESETVTTNGTVPLSVLACHDETQPLNVPNASFASLISVCVPSIRTATWSVNGIVRGNATVGEVAAGAPTTATYRAPATVPSPSTVSVSVGLFWAARGVTKTFTSRITVVDPDIKLRVVGTFFQTNHLISNAPLGIPASLEDRFTVDIVLSGDLLNLKEYSIVENPITEVKSGGGFFVDPSWCRPPVTTGPFDYIQLDTIRRPELVQLPSLNGGRSQRLELPYVKREPDVTYFLRDENAQNGCRRFEWSIGQIPFQRKISVPLPLLSEMPAPGGSKNLDERSDDEGWFFIIGRPRQP